MSQQLFRSNQPKGRHRPKPPSPPGSNRGSVYPCVFQDQVVQVPKSANVYSSGNKSRQLSPVRYVDEEKRPRPDELSRLPEYCRWREQPIKKDVEHAHVFVAFVSPVTVADILDWATTEIGWFPTDTNILANGGLRYAVWRRHLPNPEIHYQEVRKRIPFIDNCADAHEFFLRNARAQHEERDGPCTRRCPLCQSSLMGYPMNDHTQGNCPFDELQNVERAQFLATNNLAFCPRCNCRSICHTECEDNHKYCTQCKEEGHTITESFCEHEIGLPTEKAQMDLRAIVKEARENVFENVRWMLEQRDPFRPRYKIHFDHCHEKAILDFIVKNGGQSIIGWGPYRDPRRKYVECDSSAYANHGTREPTHYNALTPVEYSTRQVLPILHLDTEANAVLSKAAKMVDAVKRGADPYTLDLEGLREDSERAIVRTQARFEHWEQAGTKGLPVYSQPSAQKSTSQPAQKPLMKKPPYTLRKPAILPTTNRTDWFQQKPIQPWERHEEQRAKTHSNRESSQPRCSNWHSESESGSASNKSFGATPSSSQHRTYNTYQEEEEYRGNQTLPAHHGSSRRLLPEPKTVYSYKAPTASTSKTVYSYKAPTASMSSEGQRNKVLTKEEEEFVLEKVLSRTIFIMGRQTAPVGGTPARILFARDAYNLILDSARPSYKNGLVTRIRTIQFMLTGNFEVDDLSIYPIQDLEEYLQQLMTLADLLKDEALLIVQLEEHNPDAFSDKISHGSEITKVPSYTLSKYKRFTDTMYSIRRIMSGHRGTEPHRRFFRFGPSNRRRWLAPEEDQSAPKPAYEQKMIDAERNMLERLNTDHCWTKAIYEIPRKELLETLARRVPSGVPEAMRLRIQFILKLLTGRNPPPLPKATNAEMIDLANYMHILGGAMKVINAIRMKHTVKVAPTKCIEELVGTAASLHDLPLPDYSLFKERSANEWRAWLDTIWTGTLYAMEARPCHCQQ